MLIAQHDMDLVLEFMLAEVSKAEPDRLFALGLIDILKWTFENGKGDLTLQLANCAEILMRCLNPNKPDLRKFVQVLAQETIGIIITKYNCAVFDGPRQHLFLPDQKNDIVIFDLRQALRWKS